MAAAGKEIHSLQSLFACAVCFENFTDPRILQCGHHFCSKCLAGILDKQVKREISCPSCRRVTDLPPGNNVSDLPRPVLINELQEKIAGLLKTTATPDDARMCDLCTDSKVTASFYCGECDQNFCDVCHGLHKKLDGIDGHVDIPLANTVFCSVHTTKRIVMYCQTCDRFVCAQCVMRDHRDHTAEKLQDVVAESRGRLEKFIREYDQQQSEVKQAELMKTALKTRIENRTKFLEATSRIRQLLKSFEIKLNAVESGTDTKMSEEIETLSRLVSEAECLISSKRSLSERARTLLDTAKQHNLIIHEKKFPTMAELGTIPRTLPDTDSLRESGEMVEELIRNVQTNIDICCKWMFKAKLFSADHISDLTLLHKISPCGEVCGLTMDVKRQRLVVRTRDDKAPIQVYDHAGVLLEQLGAGVDRIVMDKRYTAKAIRKSNGSGCYLVTCDCNIAVDTRRDLYLVPCDSSLKLLDTKGVLQSSVSAGSDLRGVGYCQDNDVYVVSDVQEHKVYVIDACTQQVITQFGSRGSGDTQFSCPYRVCVGKVSLFDTPVIVVSDYYNHSIKMFDMAGRHVKTLGGEGRRLGRLQSPWGVAIDPAGRMIVADLGNQRVLSFWSEKGRDQWQRLPLEHLGKYPYDVANDKIARVVAVGDDETVYVYKAS